MWDFIITLIVGIILVLFVGLLSFGVGMGVKMLIFGSEYSKKDQSLLEALGTLIIGIFFFFLYSYFF